jgi:serine/threonine-protein kinase RIM15
MEAEQGTTPTTLAPPAVSALRAGAGVMERSLSEDIREEREDLREAAEQTMNVIVDLNVDGTIRWVSPSWVDVIGTQPDSVTGTALADLIIGDNPNIFADVVESMKKDDSRSQFLRFAVKLGPLSKLVPVESPKDTQDATTPPAAVDLEAQGIMVYDGSDGSESHVSYSPYSCLAAHVLTVTCALLDHVDDTAMDSSSGDQDRPPARDCRVIGLRRPASRQLPQPACRAGNR